MSDYSEPSQLKIAGRNSVNADIDCLAFNSLTDRLEPCGQTQVLRFWDSLNGGLQANLAREIGQIDWELLSRISTLKASGCHVSARAADPTRLSPPSSMETSSSDSRLALEAGEDSLREGNLGVVLVAGGQGTRLGCHEPKGLFPIGPLSNRSLFQVLMERLLAVRKRYGVEIPLFIMTSPATHAETDAFLQSHQWFGLEANTVRQFCQGVLPAIDATTGQALLKTPYSIALSPDGHGGMVSALQKSGALADLEQSDIQHLFYGQIDNPLLPICDPRIVGSHVLSQSQMTSVAIRKKSPSEKVGNIVEVDGRTRIIEYSDFGAPLARQVEPDGRLQFWAGNIGVHVFDREFLQQTASADELLPYHQALKKVSCLDVDGNRISPSEPNAMKFERFIFDLLPLADRTLTIEMDRASCFAPVKNARGERVDTPETAQAAMIRFDQRKLRDAGLTVSDDMTVEINPLWALDADELSKRGRTGPCIDQATYFSESGPVTTEQTARRAA